MSPCFVLRTHDVVSSTTSGLLVGVALVAVISKVPWRPPLNSPAAHRPMGEVQGLVTACSEKVPRTDLVFDSAKANEVAVIPTTTTETKTNAARFSINCSFLRRMSDPCAPWMSSFSERGRTGTRWEPCVLSRGATTQGSEGFLRRQVSAVPG